MSEQTPSDPRKHRTDHKRQHLEAGRIHAHRFGGDFVIANRNKGAAVAGGREIPDRGNGDQYEQEDPEKKKVA